MLFYPNPDRQITSFPNLIDLSWDQSKGLLIDYNYELIYEDSLKAENTVIKTDPKPYSFAPKGAKVNIYVSTGYMQPEYPDFENILLKNALDDIIALEKAHNLKISYQYIENKDYPSGYILTQSPKSGKINSGDVLNLTITTNQTEVILPDFTGKDIALATAFCNQHNLLFQIDYEYTILSFNFVISQSIMPDSLVYPNGGVIIFTVSKGLPDIDNWTLEEIMDLTLGEDILMEVIKIPNEVLPKGIIDYYFYCKDATLCFKIIIIV